MVDRCVLCFFFFFSSRRQHTRCSLVTGVQTCALPISFLDVNTLLTLAALRYSQRARIAQKFPRHKLASDGTKAGAGQAIVTPSVIRAELVALAREWEDAGWVENMDGDRKSTRLNSSH